MDAPHALSDALAAALALDRGIRARAAAEVQPIAEGLVVRHPELFDVHYLNAVLLDDAWMAPAAAVELADRWLGDLGHRHVVFDSCAAGERVAAELEPHGWDRRRTLFMAFGGDVAALPADPRARRISPAQMHALQLAALREEMPEIRVRADLAERLGATQAVLRRATPALCFGAGEADGLQSMCTLFLHEGAAMVEEVGTLVAHRGRGLARAVVAAAVRAAADAGARLIVVPADADDWPQLMYASLGFEPLGRQVSITLRTGSARAAV